jgi:hypothetical protein
MKKTLLVACLALMISATMAQNILLFNGETPDISTCSFSNGNADNTNQYSGNYCFQGNPTMWAGAGINLNCQNSWRIDISKYDELWFYAKCSAPASSTTISITGWPYSSKIVDISNYIPGGALTGTYQLVRIPIDSLKTNLYNLSSIEYIYLSASSSEVIYADNFYAMDLSPNTITNYEMLSEHAVHLNVSGSYDTTDVKILSNYNIISTDDADFFTAQQPAQLGMRYFVAGFDPSTPNPDVKYELYLIFNSNMKNGKHYELTVTNVKDRSGNNFLSPQHFSFVYNNQNYINNSVKVNQVGYLPQSPKYGYTGNYLGSAGLMQITPASFEIRDAASGNVMYTGTPSFRANDTRLSGEKVYECDFENFTTPGKYFLYVPGVGRSYPFKIGSTVYDSVYYTCARGLYYQRCGTALPTPYAAPLWARGACHVNDGFLHTSQSSSPLYNAESIGANVNVVHGWHDAGDYGKYTVTASGALYYLFLAYDLYPEKFGDNEHNIPESGNAVPDILDEAKWEIDFLKEMQAPDGGVYQLIADAQWASGMPNLDSATRHILEKTTFATGCYAASMAAAYRCFHPFWPVYADTCLARSKRAMNFLLAHPTEAPVGGFYLPSGFNSGGYTDDEGDVDERAWASAELYKSTGIALYDSLFTFYWSQHPLGWGYNYKHRQTEASLTYATITAWPVNTSIVSQIKTWYNASIEGYQIARTDSNYYHNANRTDVSAWIGYGSFAQSTRYAWDLIVEHYLSGNNISGNQRYVNYAKINLDTQFGDNPQNLCYITGLGSSCVKNPLVNESAYRGLSPYPGVPVYGPMSHLNASNPYNAAVQSPNNLYPDGQDETKPYPLLRRYYDCIENDATTEFDIAAMVQTSVVTGFLKSLPTTTTIDTFGNISKDETINLTCFPNPAAENTNINFFIPATGKVSLTILDMQGKKIISLVDESISGGNHSILMNSSGISAGIYFCRLQTPFGNKTHKLVVMK